MLRAWLKQCFARPLGFKLIMAFWPPYWGAGVRVESVSDDFRQITVSMKFGLLNRNYVGSHFGGSLFSMVDPFYMLMLLRALGQQYYVWDKSAKIEFIKPGLNKVIAKFAIDDVLLEDIKKQTEQGDKYFIDLNVDIVDTAGELIATVERKLYIRKKPAYR